MRADMDFRKGMCTATWDRKESPTRRGVSIQDPSISELEGKLESERRQKENLQAELARLRAELQASRTGNNHELWAEVRKVRADLEDTRAELMSIEQQVPSDQASSINSIFINNMENPTRIRLKNVRILPSGEGFGNNATDAGQSQSQWQVTDPDAERAPTFTDMGRGEQRSTSKSPVRAAGEQQNNLRSQVRGSPGSWGDTGQNEQANAQNYPSSWRTTSESKGYRNFEGGAGIAYDTNSTSAGGGDISDALAKLRRTLDPLRG